jgi:serine kinase of HPr protein (carbohydrate metabolism regulator)
MLLVHGTSVAIDGAGVLLCGESGAGKSDLALRLIAEGARLVADDQTLLSGGNGRVVLRAPDAIRGKLEVRGLGIVEMEYAAEAPLVLVVDLVESPAVERLPEPRSCRYLDTEIALIHLASFEASAPAKVRLALRHLAGREASPRP